MIDAEIGQRLGIHADPAAQPLKRNVLVTQTRYFTRAANPFHCRKQPKRQQYAWVRWWMARSSVHRLDGGVKCRQIEPSNEIPHQTDPVIVRQQPIETDRAPRYLIAFGKPQTWQPATRRLRRGLLGQTFKQFSPVI